MYTNPILGKVKNLYMYLAFWVIICSAYSTLLVFVMDVPVNIALLDGIVFNLLLAGIGLSLWFPVRYISFEDNKPTTIVLNHLAGGMIATAFWLGAGYALITLTLPDHSFFNAFFAQTLIWRFVIGALFYFLIVSFYYLIIYYNGFHERELRESELKSLLTEAELRTLKFQINPHFVFNSLNSLSALTMINPERAQTMILKLADFLRYTLSHNEQQNSMLSEELANIKRYLEIEKIRFEDKFSFTEEVDEACYKKPIPSMLLQPLIENAIKHAVYESLGKVELKLKCRAEAPFMRITIENNFEPGGGASRPGTGTGLKNIKNRMLLLYNRDDLLEVKKEKNIFKVSLYIPCDD